jgi:hypothetical protein
LPLRLWRAYPGGPPVCSPTAGKQLSLFAGVAP